MNNLNTTVKTDLVSAVNEVIKKRSLGTAVNILIYTSTDYTTPSDGYVRLSCSPRTTAFVTLYVDGVYMLRAIGVDNAQTNIATLFVQKKTKLRVNYDALTGITREASFIPLK